MVVTCRGSSYAGRGYALDRTKTVVFSRGKQKLSHKARKGSDRHARDHSRKAQKKAEQSHKRAEKAVKDAHQQDAT